MLAFALPLIVAACDLSALFSSPADWERSCDAFVQEHRADGFRYASDRKDVANCMCRGACTWNGLEVWEARIYCREDRPSKLEMSMYNRGDSKGSEALDAQRLGELLGKVAAAVEPGAKPEAGAAKTKLRTGGFQYVRRFTKGTNDVELAWGVDGAKAKVLTADYVRVTVSPKSAARAPSIAIRRDRKPNHKANVVKNAEGDVWIDNVPMVDQGQKGYCACAVSERVLRYFGKDVDEHQIAQMAGSTADGGTSVDRMIETVRAVGAKNRLGFQPIVSMNGTVKDIYKEVEQYNKAAKSMRSPEIDVASCMQGNTIMVGMIRERMKPEVVLKMRTRDSRFRRFLNGVKTQIDSGTPVFWGVTLGMFPEPEIPQASGGHMRLIIGYNQKTHRIFYSDTWGAGHERKAMDEDKAFAITHDAFYLKQL
ncbi:MAG: C39 family peptidase [Kiritimatiellae bacterium]|nr:C39 family peptidase [Kiritimatiellia bacterium]